MKLAIIFEQIYYLSSHMLKVFAKMVPENLTTQQKNIGKNVLIFFNRVATELDLFSFAIKDDE